MAFVEVAERLPTDGDGGRDRGIIVTDNFLRYPSAALEHVDIWEEQGFKAKEREQSVAQGSKQSMHNATLSLEHFRLRQI